MWTLKVGIPVRPTVSPSSILGQREIEAVVGKSAKSSDFEWLAFREYVFEFETKEEATIAAEKVAEILEKRGYEVKREMPYERAYVRYHERKPGGR